jgi:type IV secretory pathway VirB10-like protein
MKSTSAARSEIDAQEKFISFFKVGVLTRVMSGRDTASLDTGGFSLELDKYVGLDPLGTTGLATKVDHGYVQAFAAAAAVGGLGGLAQIGNSGSVLSPSTQIRDGISEQSAAEGEQVLNHFLNRLPIITLKEGSRARVYIGTDILIPSYAEHRVDSTL